MLATTFALIRQELLTTQIERTTRRLMAQARSLSPEDPEEVRQWIASVRSELWSIEAGLEPSNVIALKRRAQ